MQHMHAVLLRICAVHCRRLVSYLAGQTLWPTGPAIHQGRRAEACARQRQPLRYGVLQLLKQAQWKACPSSAARRLSCLKVTAGDMFDNSCYDDDDDDDDDPRRPPLDVADVDECWPHCWRDESLIMSAVLGRNQTTQANSH